MQELQQIENTLEQLKKEVWYLAKVTIPSLNINSIIDRLSKLESAVKVLSSKIDQ